MTNWVGTKTMGCRHLAQFDVDEILSLRRPWEDTTKTEFFAGERRLKVRMNSIRYHLFAQSRVCACCGRVGTVMLLDVHGQIYSRAHFNLYAVENGELILMTRDHIVPRSRGGQDVLENLQTLCTECNGKKGDRNLTLDELREVAA